MFLRMPPQGLILALLIAIPWASNAPQQDAPPSKYAPAEDLTKQLDELLADLEKDAAASDYTADHQGRIRKNANTIAAVALVLGMHDQANPFKPAASKLIEAANGVASVSEDQAGTREAVGTLKQVLADKPAGQAMQWRAVADLSELMKQVPIVNNSLRRGVTSRRFKRSQEATAGYAATLAAIAQASLHDTSYCGDESDEATWKKICAEFRDASAEVNQAVRRGDQEKAKAAMARVVETCDACHESFR